MSTKEPSFWLVWNPNGHNPTFRHDTARGAEQEAQRLARENPGARFYVLKAVSAMRRVDVEHIVLDDRDIPF